MKIKKVFRGRRGGGVGDILTIVFSILLWAFIVLVFTLLMFTVKGCSKTREDIILSEKSIDSNLNIFVINYLRRPVRVDEKEIDIAELIGLWAAEPKRYEKNIKEETSKILESSKLECVSITISHNLLNSEIKKITITKPGCSLEGLASIAVTRGNLEQYVRSYDSDIIIPVMNGVDGVVSVNMNLKQIE